MKKKAILFFLVNAFIAGMVGIASDFSI